jgi:hypothetical protein
MPTHLPVPSANLGLLYVNNLQVTRTGNTTVLMQAGQCRDSTDTVDITLSTATTCDLSGTGANGLDTGTIAASTFYYIYIINASIGNYSPAVLASLSSATPTLPFGYDSFRLIDVQLTDGSSHLLPKQVIGNGNARQTMWETVIAGTAASSGGATALALIDLSAGVPPIDSTLVKVNVGFVAASAGDVVGIGSGVTTAAITGLQRLTSQKTTTAQYASFDVVANIVSAKPQIQYINSASSGTTTAFVAGFTLYI